ncbi:MAG: hypothetical protein V2I63_01220 [Pseudomonadales bacterium]|jgi:hypothetical protein|nr:hypothetical protein [Pseudomonadales bacterium]
MIRSDRGRRLRFVLLGMGGMLLAGCVTAPRALAEREAHWQALLAREAPIGAARAQVLDALERNGLPPTRGTYRTVHEDGRIESTCRLPDEGLTVLERGAVRGLYLSWDTEVTVCFDEAGRVEDHFVGSWNAGL